MKVRVTLLCALILSILLVSILKVAPNSRVIPSELFNQPRTSINLNVKLFPTIKALNNYIAENHPQNDSLIREGLAVWYQNTESVNDCTILVVREEKLSKAEPIIGHELLHCIYGSYHN